MLTMQHHVSEICSRLRTGSYMPLASLVLLLWLTTWAPDAGERFRAERQATVALVSSLLLAAGQDVRCIVVIEGEFFWRVRSSSRCISKQL